MNSLVYKSCLPVLLMFFLQGCRAYINMHTGIRPDSDFFTQKYYAWLPQTSDTNVSNQIQAFAKLKIEQELANKGYCLSPDSATIYLDLRIENKLETETIHLPWLRPTKTTWQLQGLESAITLTVHDLGLRQMLWAGGISGKIYNLKHWKGSVTAALKALMKNYPDYGIPYEIIWLKEGLTNKNN